MSAPPLSSWHAQRSAGTGGTRVFSREWRAHGQVEPRTHRGITDERVALISNSQESNAVLGQRLGLDPRIVAAVRKGEIVAPTKPFVPLCMTLDELADWDKHNRTAAFAAHGAARTPCEDCLLSFALEMRAIGKCNGTPGAAADVEDDEPEEPAARRTMASVKATVTAPCGTCAHEPVCDRIASLARLEGQINVESTPLHAGLSVVISASIECDAYLRVKGANTHARAAQTAAEPAGGAEAAETPSGRARPHFSPESLQHLRDNAARNRAKLAEQRAAAKQLETAAVD